MDTPSDDDRTRLMAGGDALLVTRAELVRMVDEAVKCVMAALLEDWARERHTRQALLQRALVRLCEQGDSALSSALVREIRDAVGH